MKKTLSAIGLIIFGMSFCQNIAFDKLYGNSDPVNYYIGHYPVPGTDGLDIKWDGGVRLQTAGGLMQLGYNGNIGIGTVAPQSKLDILGGINIASGFPIQLSGSDPFHGLKYKRYNIDNSLLDGPFLYGWYGGALGIKRNNGDEFNVLSWKENGNVAIQGKLEAKELKVTLTPTADFVFDEHYNLPELDAVEKHIKEKKHLPEIASAEEMEKEGVNVGEFQIKLLQKIEELTLYTIEQNKQLKKLQNNNNRLMEEIKALKANKK